MIALLAPFVGLFMVAGVLTVDVGLFFSDRRNAQATVDLAARAGALELTLNPTQSSGAAYATAVQYLSRNDYQGDDPSATYSVSVSKDCYSANDGAYNKVSVEIARKPKMTGFLGWFGVTWMGGAQATACVGRPVSGRAFFPFALSADSSCFNQSVNPPKPIPGAVCVIRDVGSVNGTYGALSIDPAGPSCSDKGGGANDLEAGIESGTNVMCTVYPGSGPGIPYDFVYSKQGDTVGPTKAGLACRLKGTAGCAPVSTCDAANHISSGDADSAALPSPRYRPPNNGIDDIFEIWRRDPSEPVGSLKLVTSLDCNPNVPGIQTSPRNVVLIVVNHTMAPDGTTCGGGSNSYCVRGFVRGYLEGCLDKNDVFKPLCDPLPGSKLSVVIRFVEQLANETGDLGFSSYGDLGVHLVR